MATDGRTLEHTHCTDLSFCLGSQPLISGKSSSSDSFADSSSDNSDQGTDHSTGRRKILKKRRQKQEGQKTITEFFKTSGKKRKSQDAELFLSPESGSNNSEQNGKCGSKNGKKAKLDKPEASHQSCHQSSHQSGHQSSSQSSSQSSHQSSLQSSLQSGHQSSHQSSLQSSLQSEREQQGQEQEQEMEMENSGDKWKAEKLAVQDIEGMTDGEKLNWLLVLVMKLQQKCELTEEVMDTKIQNSLQAHKKEVDRKLKSETKKLDDKITELKQTLREEVNNLKTASKPETKTEHKLVVKNLQETKKENLMNKVLAVIRDGLKLKTKIAKVERKLSRNDNRPGIVIVTCENINDKREILSSKRKLKSSKQFSEVYIDDDKPRELREQERNMRVMAKALGNVKVKGAKMILTQHHMNSQKQKPRNYHENNYRHREKHSKFSSESSRSSQSLQKKARSPYSQHEEKSTGRYSSKASGKMGMTRKRVPLPEYHTSQVPTTSGNAVYSSGEYSFTEEENIVIDSPPVIPHRGKGKTLPCRNNMKNRRED